MKGFLHAVKQVFSGDRAINERKKYQVIEFLIAMIHLFFTVIFFSVHIWVLFGYNVFAVIYYISMVLVTGKVKKYNFVFVSAFMEILFHSVLASILLGWDWGFMIYTMGLVPITFYVCYTIKDLNQNVAVSAIASMIVCIVYFVVNTITETSTPVLGEDYPQNIIDFMYYFNTALTFVFLWVISVLFALEIRFMQRSLEKENHSLENLANYDPLTHLLNRRSMNSYMSQAHDRADTTNKPFCLIMADIDDFKRVNDTYGHSAGDEVLIRVAAIISGNVRKEDQVCRWGGEEILVLVKADKETTIRVAERIRNDVQTAVVNSDDGDISVTLTMGVVQYHSGDNVHNMIDKADQRLYYGKNHGKNQVVAEYTT